jgi:hypothetical protein
MWCNKEVQWLNITKNIGNLPEVPSDKNTLIIIDFKKL